MRDVRKYPITTAEIIETLSRLRDEQQIEIERTGVIGSMTALILAETIERMCRLASLDDE